MSENVVEKFIGILDPGGDPEAIRRVAAACRTLASDLKSIISHLDQVAHGLAGNWSGQAAAAFTRAWNQFSAQVDSYASNLWKAAESWDKVASYIQQAQNEANIFKDVLIGSAVAFGVVTVFTFGIGAAAEAAEAGADASMLAAFLAQMSALLDGEAEALAALGDALVNTAGQMVMGMGLSTASELAQKSGLVNLIFHPVDLLQATKYLRNPLNPNEWSANDFTNILLGGDLTAGLNSLAATPSIGSLTKAYPVTSAGLAGFLGSSTGTAIGEFGVQGKPLTDGKAWETVVENGAISGGVGAVMGRVFTPGASVSDEVSSEIKGIGRGISSKLSSLSNNGEDLEAPALSTLLGPSGRPLNMATGTEQPPPPATLLGPSGQAPAPSGQAPAPSGQAPASGKWWVPSISRGDLIRGAIGIPSGAITYRLTYRPTTTPTGPRPPAPPPSMPPTPAIPAPAPAPAPQHAFSYTVQPGDSLWAIAQGNPATLHAIEQANPHINPADIQPGQVVHIPLPPPGTYTVQPGDSLWNIARGDPALVSAIEQANPHINPADIQPGQVLHIPAAPASTAG
ncbi:MAG TPA: LysM peptidoglycan-binding domain-containing protein [Streptosporangiaceae bacterium]|nr:LysM peptidoglycan-binding domain-containing protein [Streptosporangiaceae bacterium]